MGHWTPTMPMPPVPRAAAPCCEYCRREIRGLPDSCAGCGAPITAEANVYADFGLIEITTIEDAQRRWMGTAVSAGLLTVNEAREVLR